MTIPEIQVNLQKDVQQLPTWVPGAINSLIFRVRALCIPRQPVRSSNILQIGYDESKKLLVVAFAGGGLYAYEDVALPQVQALRSADSIGSHFQKSIRNAYKTTSLME